MVEEQEDVSESDPDKAIEDLVHTVCTDAMLDLEALSHWSAAFSGPSGGEEDGFFGN